ncbi:MAG: crotonase/enoyl-CoA hydratase family protein [Sulfuricaulis sp.]
MDGKQEPRVGLAQGNYRDLVIQHDLERRALWCYMRPSPRPCYTSELLAELEHFNRTVEQCVRREHENGGRNELRFLIFASRVPGVFNLGGDLTLLIKLIRATNRDGLFRYTKSCIDLLHVGYHLPITTISLVQGDALGGGFEGALATQVLIAERRAQMGLPEILFNLFPGMGAYSLLARRLDSARAERLILSGRMYSAEELYEMGVVDVLAENGEGEKAVYAYMRKHNHAPNGYEAVRKVRQIYHPISYDELMSIGTIWVDAALRLNERDLRIMERIARTQEKLLVLRPPVVAKQIA